MDIDQARTVFEQIEQTGLINLKEDLYKTAIRYAEIRTTWYCSSLEERKDMDANRTRAHNAFIDACNILSRNMVKEGCDIHWRAILGEDRKMIGDFACYLHCIFGLRAR